MIKPNSSGFGQEFQDKEVKGCKLKYMPVLHIQTYRVAEKYGWSNSKT
jgi:hypothetical protein